MFVEKLDHMSKIKEIYDIKNTHPKPGQLVDKHLKTWLIANTPFLSHESTIMQRVWHIANNIHHNILCSSCTNNVSWRRDLQDYSRFCSQKCARNNEDVKQKTKQTNLQKYGVEHIGAASIVRSKTKDTVKQRYGVDNISQIPNVKDKKIQTCIDNFSVAYPTMSSSVLDKRRTNNIEKYGHTNVLASEYGRHRTSQTNLLRYGDTSYNRATMGEAVLSKLMDKDWMLEQHITKQQSLTQISLNLNIDDTTVKKYMILHNIETKLYGHSLQEQEIAEILSQHTKIIVRDKLLIKPYELDIVVPSAKIAIEFCGLYWHSEQLGKDKYYHKNKYDMCKQQGYQLLTIFSDEWDQKRNVIINMLLMKIGCSTQPKIHGRETTVRVVSQKEKSTFHNNYHIQGNCNSSINLGLYKDNHLVAVASFKRTNQNYYLERYSTSGIVRGGFTKLIKHFKQHYNFERLITFADNRYSDGSLYLNSGFVLDSMIAPDYSYSTNGHNRFHKFNFRHKYLSKRLKNYDPSKTEMENCDINGVYRIWDCGKMRFILICSK